MGRKDQGEPEQKGAPAEVSGTHEGKDLRGNEGGTTISSLHAIDEDEEQGGGRAPPAGHDVLDQSGRDDGNNKIQSTDFSSLKVPFPWRLWQLLEDSEKNGNQSIVSWLPDGDGFAISKPYAFTIRIMKAYFALTTYDAFIQELLRYGFSRTTMELKRVDVFRNPRYSRKEKIKSLAIRRRSVARSFCDKLTAAKLHQQKQQCENEHEVSSCWAPSSDHNSLPNPVLMSLSRSTSQSQVLTGLNQRKIHVTTCDDATNDRRVIETMNRRLFNDHPSSLVPPSSSIFFPNQSETCSGNDTVCDISFMIDGCNNFQHAHDGCQSTSSTSLTQYHQSVDGNVPFSPPDPLTMPINAHPQQRPVCNNRNDKYNGSIPIVYYNGWIAPRTSDPNHNAELLRRAWQFLETSGAGGPCPESSHDTLLARTLPTLSSNVSNAFSQPAQIFSNIETQHELEKTLDEDIMESIFD